MSGRAGRRAPAAAALLAAAATFAATPCVAAGRGSREPSAGVCTPAHLNASSVLAGTPLSASPLPGSRDASPRTQISLLGAPAAQIAVRSVRGSRSGSHRGVLRGYSQGDGASFVAAAPFRAGETVTVTGAVRVGHEAARFAFSFTVARDDAVPDVPEAHVYGPDPNEKQHFVSAPALQPPALAVSASSPQASPGYVFAAPYGGPGPSGPLIFDEAGHVVWFDPLPTGTEATNLQVQQLEGAPVLTWWQGSIPAQGFGEGEDVIADASYRRVARVLAGNGYKADLHDFRITPQTTALVTVFNPLRCDLSSDHGRADAAVTDSIFQELDLRTGLVRREWHSLDHVPLSDSYSPVHGASTEWPFDYFHINSLQQLEGARMLISARNTWALYELSLATGQVLRRIGGRHSDVQLLPGAATAYQHDATLLPDGTISVFDNGASPKVHAYSRGLVVSLAAGGGQAAVVSEYLHPQPLLSASQGNIQQLGNGDEFIGWGAEPYFSEFSASGQLLFDARMPGSYESYRGYRFAWTGAPASAPAVAVSPASGAGPVTVFASWNGDTRTASWRVLGGSSPHALAPVASAARSGFETGVAIGAAPPFVAVQALDSGGNVLGMSATIHG